MRSVARLHHLSLRAGQAYSDWIRRFILFHRKRHPEGLGAEQIRQFLSHPAVEGHVSASTQNVALCALLFLYRDVLQVELSYVEGIQRAKRPARVPVVFTRGEVSSLMSHLTGAHPLIAGSLYGSGLRLMEAVRLRVKDLDFEYMEILVRGEPVRVRRLRLRPRTPSSCRRRPRPCGSSRTDASVIVNALGAADPDSPEAARPAFTDEECDAVRDWVRDGGALLLITDHEPAASAAESLATRFEVGTSKISPPTNKLFHQSGVGGKPCFQSGQGATGGAPDYQRT